MSRNTGMSLVESVVAIGLSGIFVVMLSNMLAQTMQLMRTSQDELIAVKAAELLIENAKTTPYERLQQLSAEPQPFKFVVNLPDANSFPDLRRIPVQLDLTNNQKIFGAVDGNTGTVNLASKWSLPGGNYFDGEATEEISDSTTTTSNFPSFLVTVTVGFKAPNADKNVKYPKKIVRKAFIFQDGAQFR
ncbi:MAG: type II secretion system protein [Candidatus Melainabacteria bacterium]|nr:type II secretion system protein [Candidatus Melainabacteria bacterium]